MHRIRPYTLHIGIGNQFQIIVKEMHVHLKCYTYITSLDGALAEIVFFRIYAPV